MKRKAKVGRKEGKERRKVGRKEGIIIHINECISSYVKEKRSIRRRKRGA